MNASEARKLSKSWTEQQSINGLISYLNFKVDAAAKMGDFSTVATLNSRDFAYVSTAMEHFNSQGFYTEYNQPHLIISWKDNDYGKVSSES